MTSAAVDALQTEIGRARALFASLTAEEWQAASACPGWRVQDVAQHMAAVFQEIAAPDTIDVGDSGRVETRNEVVVDARRDWTPAQVRAAYDDWAAEAVPALAAMQAPTTGERVVTLVDLGRHPLHLLGNAILFDHYCHLRHDIGAAVERAAELPRDDGALQATVEWMLAGLPQMCADALAAAPAQPVNLVFDGPGAGSYLLSPGPHGWKVAHGVHDDVPIVMSTAHDFVAWATKRADWRAHVTGDVAITGVPDVLDAINII